jgi:LuxR family maltose regulon positive regulatory protein
MIRMNDYLESKAPFLLPNFKALQTERAIRCGNTEAAREWLFVYASRANRLPLYQMCRHFTTLRSYIAVENYPEAAGFGNRLQKLAAEYFRPLDMIESGLLTAAALWRSNKKNEAVKTLEQAVTTAMPYGFVQLFINEGKDALPLLLELRERAKKSAVILPFMDRIIQAISTKHNLNSPDKTVPKLTAQQRSMLQYLGKGMTYNEIAAATGIRRATVKYHVLLVYKALGVHDAHEAVMKAKMMGLVE